MSFDKILVQLNDKKFVIHIESGDNNNLKNVCHEIRRQTKQLISFESHSFEIFEPDFEEYVILNENDLIRHLSRIRIKDKIQDINQMNDNSEKPKTVSDSDFGDNSSQQIQGFTQSLDYSREMTSFWVNSIPQNDVPLVPPISNSFVKPFDTQSERSCGHSSVSSSGLRSFRSEALQSSVEAKHKDKPKTVSTTGLSDNKSKNIQKIPEKDFNSFCDYLFVTKSSNSSKNDNSSDKSVSTHRAEPSASITKLNPSVSKSKPFCSDSIEKNQINDSSCDESNKWFMNFSKDKSVVRERVDSNNELFTHSNRFDIFNEFIKDTNQKSGHKSVETICANDLPFNSNIKDNSDFGLQFSKQSSPKRSNKSTISSTITSKSLNESLFGSNTEVLFANTIPNSHQKSVNSSVDSNSKTSEDIQNSEFIHTLFNSMTTNTNVDRKCLSPQRSGSGDQTLDVSNVLDMRSRSSGPSPSGKLQKAMNSLKEKRVFENVWSNQTTEQMSLISSYDSNSNDLSSFRRTLFGTNSNVFTNNFIGVTSDVFENPNSEPKPQSIETPICFRHNLEEEINILSNFDYLNENSDTFDEFNYNCDDIKNVDKEIIAQNEDLNSSSSGETIVASCVLENLQKCGQMANDFESKSESDLQMNCDFNDENSVWFIQNHSSSEPNLNSSFDELISDFNNTSDKQTLESIEDSNITGEQTVLAKECLDVTIEPIGEDIESNHLSEVIDIITPNVVAIEEQTIEKCGQNSSEASIDSNDWESNSDLRRIKLNSFELFGDSEPIKEMLQILGRNKTRFAKNVLTHLVDNPKWKIISEEMIKIGFNEWSLYMCKTNFIKSFRLYKESLIKCPDIETAVIVYPFFTAFHSVDLRFILSSDQFKQLEELRDSFDKKQKSKTRNSSVGSEDIESEDLEPLKDKIAIESTKLEKISKLTEQKINLFKAMVECVDDITKEYGHVSSVNNFWELVTGQMKLNGFRIYTDDFCKDFFRECVNDYYSMVLIKAPDLETAQRVYRLFDFIHSMDLKLYLTKTSFKKIRKLRKEFSERINKTSNNV